MNFKSVFKDELNLLVLVKRNEGLKYFREEALLNLIDQALCSCDIKEKKINEEQFLNLMKCFSSKSNITQKQLYEMLVKFIKFVSSQGNKECKYVEMTFYINNNFVPHLYSREDIHKIIAAIDDCVENEKGHRFYRLYYSYSIIIRLLYSCGLRRKEALSLTYENINFGFRTINIMNSKRNVSRIIPLSDSMFTMLNNYINHFSIKSGLVFTNSIGNAIDGSYMLDFYRRIIRSLGFSNDVRLHDLRHQFVNEAYVNIVKAGMDEKVALVYLHRYLGHNSIYETEHYLHFTIINQEELLKKNSSFSLKLFSEVKIDEK